MSKQEQLKEKGLDLSSDVKATLEDIAALRGIIAARQHWQQFAEDLDEAEAELVEDDAEVILRHLDVYEYAKGVVLGRIAEAAKSGRLRKGFVIAKLTFNQDGSLYDRDSDVRIDNVLEPGHLGYTASGRKYVAYPVKITEEYADKLLKEVYDFVGAEAPAHEDFKYFWRTADGFYARQVTPTRLPSLVLVENRGHAGFDADAEWPLHLVLTLKPKGSSGTHPITQENIERFNLHNFYGY